MTFLQDHQVGGAPRRGRARVVGVHHLDDQRRDLLAAEPGEQRRRVQVPGQLVVLAGDPRPGGGREQPVRHPVLRQVEHDDGVFREQFPAEPGHHVLPSWHGPAEDVEPAHVLVRGHLQPARRGGDPLLLGARPQRLALLVLLQFCRVQPRAPFGLLPQVRRGAPRASAPSSTTGSQQHSASPPAAPHAHRACATAARGPKSTHREQSDDDEQPRPHAAGMLRGGQRRYLRRIGLGLRRRRAVIRARAQPRLVGNPA